MKSEYSKINTIIGGVLGLLVGSLIVIFILNPLYERYEAKKREHQERRAEHQKEMLRLEKAHQDAMMELFKALRESE
jgi:hypothetical protein